MKRISFTIAFCVAIVNAYSADSSPSTIATAQFTSGGGQHAIFNSINLFLSNGGSTNGGTASLFESFSLSSSNSGQVLTVNQSIDSDFNLFVSRLTNGVNDLITRGVVGKSGGFASELTFFSTRPPNGNGIDLAGFLIDHIDMNINQLTVDSPGSNPNGDGIWTDYSFDVTFNFIGSEVPEPSGAALLLIGLGCLTFARRHFSRTR